MASRHEQIGQSAGDQQTVGVLVEPAIAHLGEAEHPLDDPDRMFDPGPDLRLGPIFRPLNLIHDTAVAVAAIGEILRSRRMPADHRPLAAISLIAPHPGLLAMQQIGQHRAVGGIGRGGGHRMDQLGTAVDAKMSLHAEVPLVALLGLMHLGITRLLGVLGRRRRVDDRGVDDRAGGHLQSLCHQMPLHFIKQLPAQIMLFQQMAEAAHCRLVRHRLAAEIDADKIAHRHRIVERLFHRRVRQVEPLLQKIDAQHPFDPNRRAAIAGLGIERLDQSAQPRPRNHSLHLSQKYRPPRRLAVTFKPHPRQRQLLHCPNLHATTHPAAHYITITGRWLLQRFPNSAYRLQPVHAEAHFLNWTKTSNYQQGTDYFRHNGGGEMLVFSAADFEDFRQPRPDMPAEMESELGEVVRILAVNKWPWRLHATYDETISRALDAFERVNQVIPISGLHWFFDHAETISDQSIDRIAALGGGIAVQHRMADQGEYFVERY